MQTLRPDRTNGDDLRRDPLEVRKATLASILAKARPGIRFNEHLEGDGPAVFAHACKMGLEGIVSKRKDSMYRSGRLAGLAQNEKPGSAGGEAGGRGRLAALMLDAYLAPARWGRLPWVGHEMKLSKIDVAEAQIRAAVRMFFEGQHPVPIFTLANAAREIVASIGEQTDVRTVQSDLAEQRGVPVKKLVQPLSRISSFFKHADRDADAYLEFDEDNLEVVLQLACHDFGRVTGGMPIEVQIYEVWVTAIAFPSISKAPLRKQELLRKAIKYFPGIRSADRAGRKRIGLKVLNQAMTDPDLEMRFKREVVLARKKSVVERS